MWIPTRTYEALPALYFASGTLIVLGASYIGVSYWLLPGYLLLGVSCMIASVVVWDIRRKARSAAETSSSHTRGMAMD